MIRRHTLQHVVRQLPAYIILVGWSLFSFLVLFWIVNASLKTNQQVFRTAFQLPKEAQFINYLNVWNNNNFGLYLRNSIIYAVFSVALILLVSTPASYVLSRARFRGRALLTNIFIAGIGIPTALIFIPVYTILARLSLINTMPGLIIVYASLATPFTVFILTGFFGSIPRELEEAALIDGCTEVGVFRRVMLPLATPGIITAIIFNTINIWNEYQLALVFLSDDQKKPLGLALYSLQNAMQYNFNWVTLFAGVCIIMIPTVVMFVFLSERMVEGITMGAVK
ncbi:MAG: carbohydrate ABC transporter permease [Anaerolineae bacterium]|nr:carbohydrate ABC transporter permease [Anaerolineae bacterium]